MAKDPAFLFYPNDWLGGTLGMSFLEKGAYMELLMMQFNRGHMTYDMIAHVLGQNGGQKVDELWLKLKHKFSQDEKGLWYNERLEFEQIKRSNYLISRGNNKKGKNQYTKEEEKNRSYDQTYDKSYENHKTKDVIGRMENENDNRSIVVKEDKKEVVNISKSGKEEKIKVKYFGIEEIEIKVFSNCEDWQLNEIEDWITKSETEFQNILIRKPELKINSNFQKAIQKFIDLIQEKGKYQTCGQYKEHFSNWLNSKNGQLEQYLNPVNDGNKSNSKSGATHQSARDRKRSASEAVLNDLSNDINSIPTGQ